MQQVYTHEGPYESIPSTASPGLQFLRHFLPALDSLDPTTNPVSPFIHPDARVVATSGTVFRNDPDEFEVQVREFNILELQRAGSQSNGDGEGKGGFVAVEMRTFMDARPVQDQAARLQRESAYGEAKSTG
ncbi:hypothetical protein KXW57_000319 [Aspergillus fumigatus]|nr:hypothetical protein KXW57_000319 [Aspergillus fumigatus]